VSRKQSGNSVIAMRFEASKQMLIDDEQLTMHKMHKKTLGYRTAVEILGS